MSRLHLYWGRCLFHVPRSWMFEKNTGTFPPMKCNNLSFLRYRFLYKMDSPEYHFYQRRIEEIQREAGNEADTEGMGETAWNHSPVPNFLYLLTRMSASRWVRISEESQTEAEKSLGWTLRWPAPCGPTPRGCAPCGSSTPRRGHAAGARSACRSRGNTGKYHSPVSHEWRLRAQSDRRWPVDIWAEETDSGAATGESNICPSPWLKYLPLLHLTIIAICWIAQLLSAAVKWPYWPVTNP